ncbi:MAG: eukaryotic-like serine/threonine-protein kinase [Acidobacteriota bacterium]|jgi:serine/threonine protein kinase/Flp pilus assembly protein TadD|nr:eukaryotic-like serine/threonine-protein kinase [Acidobacteriota bacterium]
MTPERWRQIEELFQTAVDLPSEERRPYITLACGGDEALYEQVSALVEQFEAAGDFIEEPALGATPLRVQTDAYATAPLTGPTDVDPAIGRRIGAYKVVCEIGRGGMGAVYLAERADGEFRQRVAVKLIKRGMDTDFILRRFRNERQILATLDHPYIARLLDGGTTGDGLPYFVMEHIEGLPVYRYCDERKLTVGERLRLFSMVCDAVNYAHRKLVIHRDIKPSNILVASGGVPKLLDFGIAKLLNPEFAGEITLDPTATAMRLMTPEYAAPEQVRGEPVSPSTDVYSLGVLLYELLTGHRPYRLRNRSPHEMARVICEEEPPHPSVRITSPEDLLPANPSGMSAGAESDTLGYLYWCRGATVETLRRELAGDLDNVVMKALRKEPGERYQTAEEMREDIARYIEGRPVVAPPFFPGGMRKEIDRTDRNLQRDETSLAVLPLKIIEPTGGLEAGGEYLGVGLADALITRLGSLRRFTLRPTSSVLRYRGHDSDPLTAGRELGVSYVLEGRVRRAGQTLRVTMQLLDVRAGSTVWAGQFDEATADVLQLEDSISEQVAEALVPQLTGGERLRLQKRGTDRADAYEEYMRGRYHWNTFNEEGFARALVHFSRAVSLDPDYALAYAGIADYYNVLGVYAILPFSETSAAALEAARKSVALDPALAEGYAALGFATLTNGLDWEEAERHLRRASELNPNYVTGRLWLSFFLGMQGRFDEALAGARRALDIAPLTPLVRHTLNWTLYHARRFDEAIASARILVSSEPDYGLGHLLLSLALSQNERHDESVEACEKAVGLLGRSPYPLCFLAALTAAAGRVEEARSLLEEIRRMEETRYVSPYMLALVYCRLSDTEAALAQLERALEIGDSRLAWLGVDPQFDSLRDLTEFRDVLRRTNNPLAVRQQQPQAAEPVTEQKSIAVLPLKVMATPGTEGTGDEYLGVGLADALVTRLSNVHRFIVRPTSSVLRYQGPDADPLAAGRELGVDFVIDGTIRRVGATLRVTAQLLCVEEGATRWSGRFDEEYTDVLQLEDTISEQVASALLPHISGDERRLLSKRGTDNVEADEAYMRGRYHWYTMSADGFAKSDACYRRAVTLDPAFAAAHAGIAEYHCWLAVYGLAPPAEQLATAREAAQRAIDLDETLAEAHTSHGLALLTHATQWPLAEVRFRRAIDLNPGYTQAHAHYACQLAMESRFDESITEARRACELDPLNPFNFYFLSWCMYQARRYDESAVEARRLLQGEPRYGSARFVLSWLMRRTGAFDESVAEARRACELLGEIPMLSATLACAYAAAGRTTEARSLLDAMNNDASTRFVTPYHRALVHLQLGERERALDLLEEAVAASDPWIVWLGTEPQLDPLRGHSRFRELLLKTKNPAAVAASAGDVRAAATTGDGAARETNGAGRQQTGDSGAGAAAVPRGEEDEAQKLYKAGRYFVTRRTAEGLRQAIERFERAVRLAPGFALAWAEMADSYSLLNWYVEPPPTGAWASARQSALRAVEADDTLSEAHASLGFVLFNYDRDFSGAERELRRAIELNPENAVARRWHAFNLSAMGRHDEAVTEIRKAREIAPRSPVIATAVANILLLARRFEEADDACRDALELDPGLISTHIILRWSYEMRGLCDDALAVFEQERAFAGDTPTTRAKHAHVLASCGQPGEARAILDGLIANREREWVTAYEIAVINSLLGELDAAFNWLARAEEEHSVGLTYLRVDPRLDRLRADPRFSELLQRSGRMKAEGMKDEG